MGRTLPNLKLRMELWRRRIKQVDLALDIRVDPARLSRIINGREEPTPEIKRDIARLLGIAERELF